MSATRRQVLKAAAWTLPAVAVAVATPALAASTETCEGYYSPLPDDPHNVASVHLTRDLLTVRFEKPYPHATAINVDGLIVWKSQDTGVRAGHTVTVPLTRCPRWIQVDGNNVHWQEGAWV